YLGDEGPPSLSPDGNFVAFACRNPDGTGPADICVKDVSSESVRRITETPEEEFHPAWSPDGREIAFARDGAGVLIVSQLGGHERKVSSSGSHAAWTPDGKAILTRDNRDPEGPYAIYFTTLDTLEQRRLTFSSVGVGDGDFDISPDGRSLAFIRAERPGVT